MRMARSFLLTGAIALCITATAFADAVHFNVPIDNLSNQSETGSGLAVVTLAEGTAVVNMQNLQLVPHDNPLGAGRIQGYAVWLFNTEDARGKLKLGFLFPDDNGSAQLNANVFGSNQANLALPGYNMVVVTAETVLDSGRSQPSGPPIAAGQIPGTPTATTPLPAVEVFMGDLTTNVFSFEPQTITIFSGQTVRWTNVSPEFINPHTATRTDDEGPIPNSDQAFDSGPVPFGHSFTRTFTLPAGAQFGFFNYHCTPHQQLGMTGRILVIANP